MPDGDNQNRNNARIPLQRPNLPAVLGAPHAHRDASPAPAGAAFISQLIAERQHLPPQRERRRAPVAVALDSYEATEAQAIRRMPPGYRKTLVV